MAEFFENILRKIKPEEVKPLISDVPPKWYSPLEEPVVRVKKNLVGGQQTSGMGSGSIIYEGKIREETCAIKVVALETRGTKVEGRNLLQEEYNLLARLNQLAQDHTEETGEPSFYFPRVRLGKLEGKTGQVLVMEWLPDDLSLYRHLTTIREKLPGKYEAAYFEALRQAVEMTSILNQAGIQQVDRKTADFRWKDDRLKVIDWNVQQLSEKISDDVALHSDNLWQVQKSFFEIATSASMNIQSPNALLQSAEKLATAENLSLGTKVLLLSLCDYGFGQGQQLSVAAIRQRIIQLVGYSKMTEKVKERLSLNFCLKDRNEAFVLADMIVDPKRKAKVINIVSKEGLYDSPLEKIIKTAQDAVEEAERRKAERLAMLSPWEGELKSLASDKQTVLQKLREDPQLKFSLPESVLRMKDYLRYEPKIAVFTQPSHNFDIGQYEICEAMCEAIQSWSDLPETGRPYITIFREFTHCLNVALQTPGLITWENNRRLAEARIQVAEYLERAALGILEPRGYTELVQTLEKNGVWNLTDALPEGHAEKTRWDHFRKGLRLVGELGVSPALVFPKKPDELFFTPKWEIAVLQDTLQHIDNKTHTLSGYPVVMEKVRDNCYTRMRELILTITPISFR